MQVNKLIIQSNISRSKIEVTDTDYVIKGIPITANGAVMNGVLYSKAENAKGMASIVGKPFTINHPTDKAGNFISALEGYGLKKFYSGGVVTNHYEHNDIWYADVEIDKAMLLAQNGGKALAKKLDSKEDLGVSTGLVFEHNEMSGVNSAGKRYARVAKNQSYNHLAAVDAPAGGLTTTAVFNSENTEVVSFEDLIASNAAAEANEDQGLFSRIKEFVKSFNSSSYRDIERLIESKLKAERTTSENEYLYPSETYDTFFIYEKGGTMLKQAYVVDGGELTFVNEPKPVTKDVEWTELNTNEDNSMRKLMLAGLEAKGISVNAEITDADLLVKYTEVNAAAPAANTDEVPAWAKDLAANMADMKKEMSDMKKEKMTAEEEAKAKKAKALAGNSKIAALGLDEASLLAMNTATLDNLYAKNVGTITGNASAGFDATETQDEVF